MNAGGLIILLFGSVLVIVGLRGTQLNVFPWFFGNSSNSTGTGNSATNNTGTPSIPLVPVLPSAPGQIFL